MKILICLAFILCGCIALFAQETIDTENYFLAALDKAEKAERDFKLTPHRITHTGEIILKFKKEDFERTLSSYKVIFEDDRDFASHFTAYNFKDNAKERYESIQKLGTSFERKDDGDWTKVKKSVKIGGIFSMPTSRRYKNIKSSARVERTIEYKYVGKEEINNQMTDVYMVIEGKIENKPSGVKAVTTDITKIWFAQDGMMLKFDMEIKIDNDGNVSRSRYVQIWETDENIKIELPMNTADSVQ